MKMCQCILGAQLGHCCQDPPPQYAKAEPIRWWEQSPWKPIAPSTSTGLWTMTPHHHPRITREKWASPRPWIVRGHLAGVRQFKTWAEAKAYALDPPKETYDPGRCPNASPTGVTACNCTGACHPRKRWVVKGDEVQVHDHVVGL